MLIGMRRELDFGAAGKIRLNGNSAACEAWPKYTWRRAPVCRSCRRARRACAAPSWREGNTKILVDFLENQRKRFRGDCACAYGPRRALAPDKLRRARRRLVRLGGLVCASQEGGDGRQQHHCRRRHENVDCQNSGDGELIPQENRHGETDRCRSECAKNAGSKWHATSPYD